MTKDLLELNGNLGNLAVEVTVDGRTYKKDNTVGSRRRVYAKKTGYRLHV
jgi:hypothetical protein